MGNSFHALLLGSSAVSAMVHCSTARLWQLQSEPVVGLSCTAQCRLPGGSLVRDIDCLHTLPSAVAPSPPISLRGLVMSSPMCTMSRCTGRKCTDQAHAEAAELLAAAAWRRNLYCSHCNLPVSVMQSRLVGMLAGTPMPASMR